MGIFDAVNVPLILGAAFVASASPGPATLAIASTSLATGRANGLALAAGVTTGSLMWSLAAALGLSALMFAHVWVFEAIRYAGAAYLLYLAFKSARSALTPPQAPTAPSNVSRPHLAYTKGLALHLTNPKAILFFGSLYSIGIPANAGHSALFLVIAAVGLQSFVVFHAYAMLFSFPAVVGWYSRARRWMDAAFAVTFGFAGTKILTARLD